MSSSNGSGTKYGEQKSSVDAVPQDVQRCGLVPKHGITLAKEKMGTRSVLGGHHEPLRERKLGEMPGDFGSSSGGLAAASPYGVPCIFEACGCEFAVQNVRFGDVQSRTASAALFRDYATGDAVSRITGRISLHVVSFGMNHQCRATVAEQ
jgi:hypothetical protein